MPLVQVNDPTLLAQLNAQPHGFGAQLGGAIQRGLGGLSNTLFPTDPTADPQVAKAAQNQALLRFSLGLMAGRDRPGAGLGSSLFNAYTGAQDNYQGAMQNAFHNTLLKRQADYQQQEHDRQVKLQQQQDRQSAATTASRIATGLQNSKDNPTAYWNLVANDPDVQQALAQFGITAPQNATPEQFGQLQQQLSALGQVSAPPTAARDLNLKPIIGPNGKPILVPEAQAIGQTPYDKPSQSLKAIVGPDGKTPIYVPADEAVGKTPFYKADINTSSGKLSDWTPEALDLAAENLYRTGKLPTGLGRGSPVTASLYAQAAAKAKAEGRDATAAIYGQQAYKAGSQALGQLTKQQTLVGAYEKTASKNMDLVLTLSQKVDRTGSPLINKALLAWKQGITGDPETAGFVNALTAARTEYAKVLSGATGAQGVTDSARKEADELFNKATSLETLRYVIGVAKQEMANRMSSFDEQAAQLRDSMGSKHTDKPPTSLEGWSITPVQ